MSDLKVSTGDPVRAKDWNRIVDIVTESAGGNPAAVASMSRVTARVSNDSGRNYDVGEIMQLDGFSGPTAGPPYEAAASILYSGDQPTWHTAISMPAVAAEPIPDGEIGTVVLAGQCVIKVSNTATDDFVMINATTTYQGTVTSGGIAKYMGRINNDYVLALLGWDSKLWRYNLTQASQAPSTTTAKLMDLANVEFASAVNITDPMSIISDQTTDDLGYCLQIGNKFHVIQAPC